MTTVVSRGKAEIVRRPAILKFLFFGKKKALSWLLASTNQWVKGVTLKVKWHPEKKKIRKFLSQQLMA